jgi:magnesium transporter
VNESIPLPQFDRLSQHLIAVQQLLARHRMVESLVNRQEMPRHELVDNLVHAQHLVELGRVLAGLENWDIARILEALSPEDRALAWEQLDERRVDPLLALIIDDVRVELLNRPQRKAAERATLNVFELHNGRLRHTKIAQRSELAHLSPIWVDLVAPSAEMRYWVGEYFGLELPDPDQLTDLEASARFYVEDRADEEPTSPEAHLHSDFLLDTADAARNVAVAFILYRNILFSVRKEELPVFRLQRLRARTQPGYVTDGKDVLLDLYAADAEYSADALEDVYAELEAVGRQVLTPRISDDEAASILAEIARAEDLNGRIRRNVMDTRRAVSFLMRGKFLSSTQQDDARQIMRDIESLDGHTGFLFGKINFLMDTTVGFININQNKIVKIFSVASVAFLPPTLIASIYGMNFKTGFPELDWTYGYPFALTLMAISVVLPFGYFRKKGWLR